MTALAKVEHHVDELIDDVFGLLPVTMIRLVGPPDQIGAIGCRLVHGYFPFLRKDYRRGSHSRLGIVKKGARCHDRPRTVTFLETISHQSEDTP